MSAVRQETLSSASWLQRICWQTVQKCCVSIGDQSLVSGTRFLTSLLIGGFCGAAELGSYVLGFSIIMVLLSVQLSLFTGPYIVYGNRVFGRERAELAGNVLLHFVLFAILAGVCLAVIARGMAVAGFGSGTTTLLYVLAAAAPCILLREQARQFAFAHLNVKSALMIDLAATLMQVGGLLALAMTDRLSAVNAFIVAGAACGISGVVWFWAGRRKLAIRRQNVASDFRRNWKIGRWDCADGLVNTAQAYGLLWVLAFISDPAAVGIYAACLTILQLANPLLLGMASVLCPKSAQAFASCGSIGVWHIAKMTTIVLGLATSVFCAFAMLWGVDFVTILYRGQEFAFDRLVITVLVAGLFANVLGVGPENALWAMVRNDLNFKASLAGFVVMFAIAFWLIPPWGVLGAAIAFLGGKTVTSGARWIAYIGIDRSARCATA